MDAKTYGLRNRHSGLTSREEDRSDVSGAAQFNNIRTCPAFRPLSRSSPLSVPPVFRPAFRPPASPAFRPPCPAFRPRSDVSGAAQFTISDPSRFPPL